MCKRSAVLIVGRSRVHTSKTRLDLDLDVHLDSIICIKVRASGTHPIGWFPVPLFP